MTRHFSNFVAIDWSGDKAPRQKGIALAHCTLGEVAPVLLSPQGGWSRKAIVEWLIDHARANTNMIVGLDLSPGLPFVDHNAYFPGFPDSPDDARSLWALVDSHCSDTPHLGSDGFLAHPEFRRHFRHQSACGDLFEKGAGRMREVERRQKAQGLSPSSCFNLIGAAQVGKSSLTGMRALHLLDGKIPVWPFDSVPSSGPLIVEIYTTIAARDAKIKGRSKMRDGASLDTALAALGSDPHAPLTHYTDHATDAILTAAWLRNAAHDAELWNPSGLADVATTEGWTFGVR